jgi:hypothetical protein
MIRRLVWGKALSFVFAFVTTEVRRRALTFTSGSGSMPAPEGVPF